MKIFISHSSRNKNYGNALVDLLIGVGISGDKIIFTSNDAYGIPTGQNIFTWLKSEINEKPYVIYLLSPEYYSSVACLNEMGAAWIVENEHTMIFTPKFKLDSYEFQNSALDPREIGFFINNQGRLIAFIESLKRYFSISTNPVLVHQRITEFLQRIISSEETVSPTTLKSGFQEKSIVSVAKEMESVSATKKDEAVNNSSNAQSESTKRFFFDLMNEKLKDEEVLLVHYIIEAAKYKLGTGWSESVEVDNIRVWEDIEDLNDKLSRNYSAVLRRFEFKKLIEVSELTSYGNPREVQLIERMQERLHNLTDDISNKISEIVKSNQIDKANKTSGDNSEQTDDLPF